MKNKSKTAILVECAMMIALASVLSKIEIPLWAQGGSITAASMLPIVMVSFRHGTKWGLGTAFTHSIIQMTLGFSNVLYCKTLFTQVTCILLDYVVAYTVLGLAFAIGSMLKNRTAAIVLGVCATGFMRFLCSFASGILLWGEYAPEGLPVWLYSLTYNGGYMLPEMIITAVAAAALQRFTAVATTTQARTV